MKSSIVILISCNKQNYRVVAVLIRVETLDQLCPTRGSHAPSSRFCAAQFRFTLQ